MYADCDLGWAMAGLAAGSLWDWPTEIFLRWEDTGLSGWQWSVVIDSIDICGLPTGPPQRFCDAFHNGAQSTESTATTLPPTTATTASGDAEPTPTASQVSTQSSIDVTYKVVLPLPCAEVATRSDYAAF